MRSESELVRNIVPMALIKYIPLILRQNCLHFSFGHRLDFIMQLFDDIFGFSDCCFV